MSKLLNFILFTIVLVSCSPSKEVGFREQILPILHDHCVSCHKPGGEGFERSGLDVTEYATLMKGTRFGGVITPGSSRDSTLIFLVKHKGDRSINMPHKAKMLKADEIVKLEKWVDQGAKNN